MKGSVEQVEAGSGVVKMRALVSGGVGLASCFLTSEFDTLYRMLNLFKFQFLHLENGDVAVNPPKISGD